MKNHIMLIVLMFVFVVPLAGAQQTTTPQAEDESDTQSAPAISQEDITEIEDELDALQTQLDELRASDPAQRHRLMRRYHRQMGEMMGRMRGPRRGMMMDEMPMQEHMGQMQQRMQEMMKTEDPEQRAELMQEHHSHMHNMMEMMQAMHGGEHYMMERGMRGHHRGMRSGRRGMQQEWILIAYRQMDKRLDMMQMLLQRLLHEQE